MYDLVVDGRLAGRATAGGGKMRSVDMATGAATTTPGPVGTIRFGELAASEKLVELWLPHNEVTELVGLRSDAALEPAPRDRRTWLHHGRLHPDAATHRMIGERFAEHPLLR